MVKISGHFSMDPHTLSGQHPGFQGLCSSQTHSDPQTEVVQKLHPDPLQNRQNLEVFVMVKVMSIPYFRVYFRDWLQKLLCGGCGQAWSQPFPLPPAALAAGYKFPTHLTTKIQ